MATKQKRKDTARVNGKWRKKEDVLPAVFEANFNEYSVVMDSYRHRTEGDNHIGKRLSFSPNGIYETKDDEEIEFLKSHCRTCGPVVKMEMKRDIRLKDSAKKGKGDE